MEDSIDNRLLDIKDLTVEFKFGGKTLTAVNNVSLYIKKGEMIGIVGESGCGKSMTAYSIINLIPHPGKITNGSVYFNNSDVLKLNNKELLKFRGSKVSLVYQDTLSSLNPSFNIYWHLSEVMKAHESYIPRKPRLDKIIEALKSVGIPEANKKVFYYPHQLSGGMRQRVVIAMAMLMKVPLIIEDEPTTALDVTIQKEIFDLNTRLKEEFGTSFMIISHDLYLIAERCDLIYVMYSGEIVESGHSEEIFNNPLHPYTIGLLKSIPGLSPSIKKLETITGEVQDLMNLPKGCFFGSRCKLVENKCFEKRQILREINSGRYARCWKIL